MLWPAERPADWRHLAPPQTGGRPSLLHHRYPPVVPRGKQRESTPFSSRIKVPVKFYPNGINQRAERL